MIRKLLIANRGEIAVRAIHAARLLGIRTAVVYSEADANSIAVQLADEAIGIGAPEPSASYLNVAAVLAAAKEVGADAIHPGYGFLSERAEFSEACREAGIQFVGPSPEAMRLLGSKIEAKTLAVEAGVPIAPGFFEPGASPERLHEEARKIGYPVMLKASAGGGGRGMRVVREDEEFLQELDLASEEAERAFGDGAMMVEKLIERPRHVEVQFLADRYGNIAPLFERECSIQRRHQKLIEESPSPIMTPELWEGLKSSTVALVKRSGYEGAGTAEFMLDPTTGAFYFLEVNARLQVEHPVTEAVTGIDLVTWQLRVASGEELCLLPELMTGDRAGFSGHAMEARVVAEAPDRDFLPSVGRICGWAIPRIPGVRVDTGYGPGSEVTRYYDSLLAKVIVHAESREAAIDKLCLALGDFHILGVSTNIAYLLRVLRHPGFLAGDFDTGFLARESESLRAEEGFPPELAAIAEHASQREVAAEITKADGPWNRPDSFRNARDRA